ncbi:hypothetical protein ACQ4M3_29985 [Leptolyngbya sp. AN03gr2]
MIRCIVVQDFPKFNRTMQISDTTYDSGEDVLPGFVLNLSIVW